MTTIAWDGKTLAADRMVLYGDAQPRAERKIHNCGRYIYAGTGQYSATFLVMEWLAGGALPEHRPNLGTEDCSGIAIDRQTCKVYQVEGQQPVLMPLSAKRFAVGSGREFARAAMELGKTAAEAVRLASRLDSGSGFGVDTVSIAARRKKASKP